MDLAYSKVFVFGVFRFWEGHAVLQVVFFHISPLRWNIVRIRRVFFFGAGEGGEGLVEVNQNLFNANDLIEDVMYGASEYIERVVG